MGRRVLMGFFYVQHAEFASVISMDILRYELVEQAKTRVQIMRKDRLACLMPLIADSLHYMYQGMHKNSYPGYIHVNVLHVYELVCMHVCMYACMYVLIHNTCIACIHVLVQLYYDVLVRVLRV